MYIQGLLHRIEGLFVPCGRCALINVSKLWQPGLGTVMGRQKRLHSTMWFGKVIREVSLSLSSMSIFAATLQQSTGNNESLDTPLAANCGHCTGQLQLRSTQRPKKFCKALLGALVSACTSQPGLVASWKHRPAKCRAPPTPARLSLRALQLSLKVRSPGAALKLAPAFRKLPLAVAGAMK